MMLFIIILLLLYFNISNALFFFCDTVYGRPHFHFISSPFFSDYLKHLKYWIIIIVLHFHSIYYFQNVCIYSSEFNEMFLKMLIMFICFNLDFCVSYAKNHFKRILKHSNTIQSFFFFFKSWCKVVCYTTWASHISQVQNFQQRGNNFQYIIFKFPFFFFLNIDLQDFSQQSLEWIFF